MECPYCHKEIPQDSAFCYHCGKEISADALKQKNKSNKQFLKFKHCNYSHV